MFNFNHFVNSLLQPFWWIRAKIFGVRQIRGNVGQGIRRVRNIGDRAKHGVQEAKKLPGRAKKQAAEMKDRVKGAKDRVGAARDKAARKRLEKSQGKQRGNGAAPAPANARGAGGGSGRIQPARPQPAAGRGGAAGQSARPAQAGAQANGQASRPTSGAGARAVSSEPAIRKQGIWWWKKHYCTACDSQLEKSWDACPYCDEGVEAAAAPGRPAKTRAFMVDAAGEGDYTQLLGWLVPLRGPERGELYTLAPVSIVGTDTSCTVCLTDGYMSTHHAEIRAEAGVWMLRDLGSTNGTYVNDKRVDQHELVDNDFVQFGQSLVKFKTL